MMSVRKYQKSTNLLIPKLPFSRLVREVALRVASNSMQDLRSNKQYNSLNKTRETNGFALGSRQLPSWLFKRLRKRTSPAASEIVFAMCDAVACRNSKLDRELRILLLSHFRKRGILVQALHALALGLVSSYVLLLH